MDSRIPCKYSTSLAGRGCNLKIAIKRRRNTKNVILKEEKCYYSQNTDKPCKKTRYQIFYLYIGPKVLIIFQNKVLYKDLNKVFRKIITFTVLGETNNIRIRFKWDIHLTLYNSLNFYIKWFEWERFIF